MENQTRFDLNAAIESWRNELAAQPNLATDDRRELETHLRDAIAGFQQRGLNDEESFWLARRRVGQPPQLGEEFKKIMNTTSNWNRTLAIAAWATFIISFFLPSYGAWLGWQCAMMHQFFWPQAIHGEWPCIHYLLLTLVNLLMLASPFLLTRFSQNIRQLKWLHHLTFAAVILVWSFVLELLAHKDGTDLRIGCYVWALSFALLYLSVISQFMPAQNRKTPKRA
jgi:hypothetical protein